LGWQAAWNLMRIVLRDFNARHYLQDVDGSTENPQRIGNRTDSAPA